MRSETSENADQRASGRDATLAALFRERREPMSRLAYVLTRDPETAHEVVLDAFLALHRNWDRVANPAAYLRTAVVNGCHSHHRHLRVVRSAPVVRATDVAPPEFADEELDVALGRLPFDQRVVLALRYHDDLDDAEIATVLGIRRATVRTRSHRALARLRQEMS